MPSGEWDSCFLLGSRSRQAAHHGRASGLGLRFADSACNSRQIFSSDVPLI
jgi:hypothetical protein